MRTTRRPPVAFRSLKPLILAALAAGVAAPALSQPAGSPAAVSRASADEFAPLRARLRWLPVHVGGRELSTLDAESRLLLARSAADRVRLADVGLDYRDVYGVINAETSWVARAGMGRNGVVSQGLAQLEPATAKALGVRDANDPVEAVHAAATLLKEAAQWSARRIAGLGLNGVDYARRLREGVSIYYNLSSQARERWRGVDSAQLPVETQRHIANVRVGAQQADRLASKGGVQDAVLLAQATSAARVAPAAVAAPRAEPVRASVRVPAVPHALGTIAWSDPARGGNQVVWSDGKVTREADGRVRWTSRMPG